MLKKLALLLALLVVALPVFAQDATPEAGDDMMMDMETLELPAVDPLTVTGDIAVAGSSTVFPLTSVMAQNFSEEGYAGSITIDSIGTGGGFERFCEAAETDIANASRPINEEELAACEANGRPAIEFRVGTDALAVVVSNENDFVNDLSAEQLFQIFSGAFATWADVDPSFPAEPIQIFSPGSDSGTFDYFVEEIFEGAGGLEGDAAAAALLNAPGAQFSEDDNVLVQGVEGSPYAIGYFGYAYYSANEERLKALSVDGVLPTAESAEAGEYPLARPLYIYSAAEIISEKPQVGAFINYYLTNVSDVLTEAVTNPTTENASYRYFPASVIAINEAKAHLLMAMGMEDMIPAEMMDMMMATPEA